jgi:hypothetical protein
MHVGSTRFCLICALSLQSFLPPGTAGFLPAAGPSHAQCKVAQDYQCKYERGEVGRVSMML